MLRLYRRGAVAPSHPESESGARAPHTSGRPDLFTAVAVIAVALALGGCSSSQSVMSDATKPLSAGKSRKGGPMFPEEKWGVSASRRMHADGERIPKGGGRYKVGDPYKVGGRWYQPREQPDYDRIGVASWYGSDFHGRHTANGEIFDMHALTAAHPTLPMPSYAYVTNLSNNRTVLVRINDRGPYVGDRVIDLSRRSAEALGLLSGGTGKVRVRYAGRAPLDGDDRHERQFLASRSWKGGQDIAALEREQSSREWDAFHRRPEPQNRGYAVESLAPVREPGFPSPNFPSSSYASSGSPSMGYAARPEPNAGRDYADAAPAPDTQPLWTPHQYRAALR